MSATQHAPGAGAPPAGAALDRATLDLPYTYRDDHFVDGAWAPSTGTARITVVDPATEEEWGAVPDATGEDVERAVAAARRALPGWAATAPSERAAYLRRIADEVERRAQPLAWTNTRENGSPLAETSGAAANAAGILRYFATLAEHLETPDVRPFPNGAGETVVGWDPVGVCALIAPWNFPINLVVIKLAPALLAGCTVVIKPASPTPLSIRLVLDAVAAAGVPAGVVNLVTGGGAVGDALVRHPHVAKVAFTGSTPVGRRIAAACGELLRPVTLELGGKSAGIVLPDVDLEEMSRALLRSCLRNTGQTCYISTRLLVPAARYDEVVEAVTATVAAAPLGDPLDERTVFGPVATRAQYDTVLEYLAAGHAEGARATTGGAAAAVERGYYVQPTVFADVTPGMRIAREEIFGPVLAVLRYDSEEEAVALANDTTFGLGGIVFSADAEHAYRVARRVRTGSIGLNFFASNHSAPFGGRGDSGLGVEYGLEGLHAYLSPQSVHRRVAR
ncbi:aldehyde dehydrogenase family protein [Georgenia thermotolerans]|uniref:Aldehyde dehydrogenase family protein n=1 Tax=Georgenia thermotolerans TaxID=527326 RepID=A0A7J5USV2_9MICO|nr:aldehyde dehydrogenase family protein [Georgenia thermotolerans]KAE8765331.1 aldehyde dehydrogenase family protein [Georgenia thermotolerans]